MHKEALRAHRALCGKAGCAIAGLMKFHLQSASGNIITGSGPGWVRVGAAEYRDNLLVTAEEIITGWAASGFAGLEPSDFGRMLALMPEIVLLGTGPRQRFPHPRLYRALTEAGIGLEVMDTKAACRTYNIIAGEGRRVAAGLLLT
jgi:uncharacterized protein